jgi:hypothetical protein
MGSECHKCFCVRSPNKVVDPVPVPSAKDFVLENGMKLTAIVVNQMFEAPTITFSGPVPITVPAGALRSLGFEQASGRIENRRLCFVVPCDEVGQFLKDFDALIDFSPVERRLKHMEKDVAEVRNSLYAIGEHQTRRVMEILKETGKHEQH